MLQGPRLPPVSPSPPCWLAAAGCRPPVLSADCCSSPRLCLSTKTRSKTLPSKRPCERVTRAETETQGPIHVVLMCWFHQSDFRSLRLCTSQTTQQPTRGEGGTGFTIHIQACHWDVFFLNIRTSTSKSNKIHFIYIAQIHNKSRSKLTSPYGDSGKDKNRLLRGWHLEQTLPPGRPGWAGRHEIKASQAPIYLKWHWCECERWYEEEHGRAPHWNSCHLGVLPSSLSEECRLSHAETSLNEREKKGLYRKTAHTRTSFTCTAEI